MCCARSGADCEQRGQREAADGTRTHGSSRRRPRHARPRTVGEAPAPGDGPADAVHAQLQHLESLQAQQVPAIGLWDLAHEAELHHVQSLDPAAVDAADAVPGARIRARLPAGEHLLAIFKRGLHQGRVGGVRRAAPRWRQASVSGSAPPVAPWAVRCASSGRSGRTGCTLN